jgi:hypothetical protein
MIFSEARSIVWKLAMMSPFDRKVVRQARIDRLLATHTRKSVTGLSTRWMFKDASVVELRDGKYRVVTSCGR